MMVGNTYNASVWSKPTAVNTNSVIQFAVDIGATIVETDELVNAVKLAQKCDDDASAEPPSEAADPRRSAEPPSEAADLRRASAATGSAGAPASPGVIPLGADRASAVAVVSQSSPGPPPGLGAGAG